MEEIAPFDGECPLPVNNTTLLFDGPKLINHFPYSWLSQTNFSTIVKKKYMWYQQQLDVNNMFFTQTNFHGLWYDCSGTISSEKY